MQDRLAGAVATQTRTHPDEVDKMGGRSIAIVSTKTHLLVSRVAIRGALWASGVLAVFAREVDHPGSCVLRAEFPFLAACDIRPAVGLSLVLCESDQLLTQP